MAEHETLPLTGGCRCGAVRFNAHGPAKRVGVCHCNDCKRQHGALFYAAAIFDENAVSLTGPHSAHEGRGFCTVCGSQVFARSGREIELHLGALDDPSALTPTYELWVSRRAPWLTPIPGAAQFDRNRENG
ncbi:MAG: GFA family protein [Pseudomonadota bacterium]